MDHLPNPNIQPTATYVVVVTRPSRTDALTHRTDGWHGWHRTRDAHSVATRIVLRVGEEFRWGFGWDVSITTPYLEVERIRIRIRG